MMVGYGQGYEDRAGSSVEPSLCARVLPALDGRCPKMIHIHEDNLQFSTFAKHSPEPNCSQAAHLSNLRFSRIIK